MDQKERRRYFEERVKKAKETFSFQNEFIKLICELKKNEVPFTIDSTHEGKVLQILIGSEYNNNCIDFIIGNGMYGLEMGWLPKDDDTVFVKGYLSVEEAMEYVKGVKPMPEESD